MGRLSTMARLHWPYLFLLSNACGRFEISYPKIISRAYSTFLEIPTRDEIHGYVSEYNSAYLLFLYRHDGSVWGQWDTSEKYLKTYKDSASLKSPAPNPTELTDFRNRYLTSKALNVSASANGISLFEKLSKNTAIFSTGKGVGVGVGIGKNISSTNPVEAPLPLFASELETHETQPKTETPPAAEPSRKASAASLERLQEKWFLEEFWPIYWRKVDKAEAMKSFKKQAFNETAKAKIVTAVTAQAPEYLSRDPEHRPHASTWLNKRRFDDEVVEIPKTPVNPKISMKYETPEERDARIEREDAERRKHGG